MLEITKALSLLELSLVYTGSDRTACLDALSVFCEDENVRREVLCRYQGNRELPHRLEAIRFASRFLPNQDILTRLWEMLRGRDGEFQNEAAKVLENYLVRGEILPDERNVKREHYIGLPIDMDREVRAFAIKVLFAKFRKEPNSGIKSQVPGDYQRQVVDAIVEVLRHGDLLKQAAIDAIGPFVHEHCGAKEALMEFVPSRSRDLVQDALDYLAVFLETDPAVRRMFFYSGDESKWEEITRHLHHYDVCEMVASALCSRAEFYQKAAYAVLDSNVTGNELVRKALCEHLLCSENNCPHRDIEILVRVFGYDSTREAIFAFLKSSPVSVEVIKALATLIWHERVKLVMLAALKGQSVDERLAAIEALKSEAGLTDIQKELIPLLFDPDKNIKDAAVAALGSWVTVECVRNGFLLALMDGRFEYDVREIIESLKYAITKEGVVETIVKFLYVNPVPYVAQVAVRVLAPEAPKNRKIQAALLHVISYTLKARKTRNEFINYCSIIAAVKALAPMFQTDERIRKAILNLLPYSDDVPVASIVRDSGMEVSKVVWLVTES